MTHSTPQRMAVSQIVRKTDSTAQTDRLVCRAYRQTAQDKQTEKQIVCDRYSQATAEADNLPIQKGPATSRYRHQNEREGEHTERQQNVAPLFSIRKIIFLCDRMEIINFEIKFIFKLKLHKIV